jgi:hypothetical protein
VLLPPTYRFTPPSGRSRRPPVALGRRANADITGAFEWRLGDRTRKANAALAGLGGLAASSPTRWPRTPARRSK